MFDFPFKLFALIGEFDKQSELSNNNLFLYTDVFSSYAQRSGYLRTLYVDNAYRLRALVINNNVNSISWYAISNSVTDQYNDSNRTYFWYIIG